MSIRDKETVVLQQYDGDNFFLALPQASKQPVIHDSVEQHGILALEQLSLSNALQRTDAWLELVCKDGYWGFRSHFLSGKLLQARRKGSPLGFNSALFGTWEQWQVEDHQGPALQGADDRTPVLVFSNRRLPSTQLHVRVHKLGPHPQPYTFQTQARQPHEDPPTPHLKWPASTPLPHSSHSQPSPTPPPPSFSREALDTPSYFTPTIASQAVELRIHPTPALPSRQTAFTPMLPQGTARQAYATPVPHPWPEATPEPAAPPTKSTSLTAELQPTAHQPTLLSTPETAAHMAEQRSPSVPSQPSPAPTLQGTPHADISTPEAQEPSKLTTDHPAAVSLGNLKLVTPPAGPLSEVHHAIATPGPFPRSPVTPEPPPTLQLGLPLSHQATPATGSVSDSPLMVPSTVHHARHRRRQHAQQPQLLQLPGSFTAGPPTPSGLMGNELGPWTGAGGELARHGEVVPLEVQEWVGYEGMEDSLQGTAGVTDLQDDVLDLSTR
ncbi:hypothetical protein DUNSADRAFT_17709 [Dunaliella salina]|uniref:Uncharacterized protein n=1 Tax=Dunaliella salina TaxID=3046 RepID=A0ABQ7GZS7_DUNSA|nr:hypothetical protein DUNSADRAFT_17709 [Dunaliella salina]|eukprot:KAF5840108.1 hypothetical protein DUNSADRAFT_17709 [Dunaliella salina]